VEILSEVQNRLGVEAQDVAALGRTRTVGEVVDAMMKELANGRSSVGTGSVSAVTNSTSPIGAAANAEVSLAYATTEIIGEPDQLELIQDNSRSVIIIDNGSRTTSEFVNLFESRAVVLSIRNRRVCTAVPQSKRVEVADYSEGALIEAVQSITARHGTPAGVVYQHDDEEDDAGQLCWALMLAKHLKSSLQQPVARGTGRSFFIALLRMDGRLGLDFSKCGSSVSSRSPLGFAERGAMFGLIKTLHLEWPHVFCRGIDVAAEVNDYQAAQHVIRELACPNLTLREVGYDASGNRYRTVGLHANNSFDEIIGSSPAHRQINGNDVFLVSGGGRGITPLCMASLARQVQGVTFILMGRSPLLSEPEWAQGVLDSKALSKAAMVAMKADFKARRGPKPTPMKHKSLLRKVTGGREVRESLRLIGAAGGKAVYVACDVTKKDAVKHAVSTVLREHGLSHVTGVVHASGVLRDKKVENKTPEDFGLVYGTKIVGLKNILAAVNPAQLRHLVVFSSLAGFHGNVGQSDYAMANEVLNKSAATFAAAHSQCRVRSLDFGPWDGGMVTPALKAMFQSQGVEIIPRPGGADLVAAILCDANAPQHLQGLVGNWGLPGVRPLTTRHVIKRTIRGRNNNEFLNSHMLHGRKVLPMTVACGYMISSAMNLYPGFHLSSISNCQLYKGIVVDEDVNTQLIVENVSRNNSGTISLDANMKAGKANGRLSPAYRATIVLSDKKLSSHEKLRDIDIREDRSSSLSHHDLYNGKTLFHGDHFQGITKVLNVSNDRLTAQCVGASLSAKAAGQFNQARINGVDSFSADVALQSMLVWARVLKGAAALPNHAEKMEFFSPIPQNKEYFTTVVPIPEKLSKGSSKMSANVFMHDEEGNIYIKGSNLEVVVHKQLHFS
jgi:hypothetical protein